MGILVGQPPSQFLCAGIVTVLQMGRDIPQLACADIGHSCVDPADGGIGLWRCGQQDHRLCQRDTGFRQAQHIGGIYAGLHNRDGLRIGQPHIFRRNDHDAAAGGDQISRRQQAGQIVKRRIRIGTPDGFLERRQNVVMSVPVPVIAHGAALADQLRILCCQDEFPVLLCGCGKQQFHRIDGFAHIAAAGRRQRLHNAIFHLHRDAPALSENIDCPADCPGDLFRRDWFELKHGSPGEDRIEHIEVWILRGRCNQRDLAVLHKLQQRLLLLFIKVLDLIQIEQDTVWSHQRVHIGDDLSDVGDARRCGIQPVQGAVGTLGNDVGHRGLARAGGAVKDHIRDIPTLYNAAEHTVLAENMRLTHHLIQRLRPNVVCQRTIFHLAHRL